MLCDPPAAYDKEHVATPDPLRVLDPPVHETTLAPSKKVTVPVGVPVPGAAAVTVAV
jgi:hypothetical protein